MSNEEREQLQAWEKACSVSQGIAARVKIVPLADQYINRNAVARKFKASQSSVRRGRRRSIGQGTEGLQDGLRPWRPRSISGQLIRQLLKRTVERKVKPTDWSCRDFAVETETLESTVQLASRSFGLRRHWSRGFKLSINPFFVEKVGHILGLRPDGRPNAVVVCVNEKSQCRMRQECLEGYTQDYLLDSRRTVFDAFDIGAFRES
jgi:putative transposase